MEAFDPRDKAERQAPRLRERGIEEVPVTVRALVGDIWVSAGRLHTDLGGMISTPAGRVDAVKRVLELKLRLADLEDLL